jgi:hypothetical protein
LKLHLHHFSKIKIQKESQNSRNQGFSYFFCIIIEGSGSRAGSGSESKPLTSESGSGSWRPKNTWIRIRNTDMIDCDLFLSFLGQARDYQLLPVWESILPPSPQVVLWWMQPCGSSEQLRLGRACYHGGPGF